MPKLPEMTPLKSSAIDAYHHDPDTRRLTVQFKGGGAYVYDDVSAEKVEAMQGAASPGGFFAAKIKPNHKATRL